MITIKNYSKTYSNGKLAVDNISLHVAKGDLYAFIGHNGAGKSTTIKMLCGIMQPDGGSCIVGDINPFKNRKEYVKHIGVVFGQKSQLWWDIPVIESFELLKSIFDNISSIGTMVYKKTNIDKNIFTDFLTVELLTIILNMKF